jgi:hypothetical protein
VCEFQRACVGLVWSCLVSIRCRRARRASERASAAREGWLGSVSYRGRFEGIAIAGTSAYDGLLYVAILRHTCRRVVCEHPQPQSAGRRISATSRSNSLRPDATSCSVGTDDDRDVETRLCGDMIMRIVHCECSVCTCRGHDNYSRCLRRLRRRLASVEACRCAALVERTVQSREDTHERQRRPGSGTLPRGPGAEVPRRRVLPPSQACSSRLPVKSLGVAA